MAAGLAVIAVLTIGCSSSPPAAAPTDAPTGFSSPASSPGVSSRPPSSPPSKPAVSPFSGLSGFLQHRAGHVTAAVFDVRRKKMWLLHPGRREYTASIVKVQIMGALLRQAEQTGKPLSAGQRALMTAMIENSDNTAATTLWNQAGGPAGIGQFDRSVGMHQTVPSTLQFIPGTQLPGWGLTTTSAKDQVTLVSKFAYPNLVFNDADRQYGLSLMRHIEADQAWGITGGVPAGTTVALKNGWVPIPPTNLWTVDSIGWVFGHGRNYVIAVLTGDDPSESYGIDTIQAISARVFTVLGLTA